jgi:hypothetical protein
MSIKRSNRKFPKTIEHLKTKATEAYNAASVAASKAKPTIESKICPLCKKNFKPLMKERFCGNCLYTISE